MKNLYSTTFVAFLFSFYANFFSATTTPQQVSNEVFPENSILLKLTKPNQDFSFSLEKENINSVQLCNLDKDTYYQLSLTVVENACEDEIYFLENPNEITTDLKIEGTEKCYELLIQQSCDLGKAVKLSVQSFSKKDKRIL